MKQTNMACFVRPRPVAPPILGTGTAGGSVTPNSNTPGVSAADKPAAVAGAGSSIVRQPAAAAAAIAASQLGVGSSNAGKLLLLLLVRQQQAASAAHLKLVLAAMQQRPLTAAQMQQLTARSARWLSWLIGQASEGLKTRTGGWGMCLQQPL
jgi:hypothetical protein